MAAVSVYPTSLTVRRFPASPAPGLPGSRRCSLVGKPLFVPTATGQKLLLGCSTRRQTFTVAKVQSAAKTEDASPRVDYEFSYMHNGVEGDLGGHGWTDAKGIPDPRVLAKFRSLTLVAVDRAETHTILAVQRQGWNVLFHTTIVIVAVVAAVTAAINGAEPAIGLAVMAVGLNLVCACLMVIVNTTQPSQLAEEQRRAARFFRRLVVEVESTLQINPEMREEASAYWEDKVGTMRALDVAFPLPLTPCGLEKFPEEVVASAISPDTNEFGPNEANVDESSIAAVYGTRRAAGWTERTEFYLQNTISRIKHGDVPVMIKWANRAKYLNRLQARVSPVLAAAAALCSVAHMVPSIPIVPWLAAVFTVGALFMHSVSHALQLGSAFETFRNLAGYYADVERAAEKFLKLPENHREDWGLFLQKMNLQLGHDPDEEGVYDENSKTGLLF